MLLTMSSRRRFVVIIMAFLSLFLCMSLLARSDSGAFGSSLGHVQDTIVKPATNAVKDMFASKEEKPTAPFFKPTPTYTPPPIKDPFPLLATSTPPSIPPWNKPRKDQHKEYNLPVAPPLLIGFTRSWPILLQAVVSYITAGWPPSQIFVVENTGVQQANTRGQLSLQNPFYLNHTTLAALGVNIIQTPVLLSFAQLQNFYLSLTYARAWPYFFWSHMDVLALSFEGGMENVTAPSTEPGYAPLYELCLRALDDARTADARWGLRFFAYDHLTLVNPAAYEDVGGWDTLIPYYITDCDMHNRLEMAGWTVLDRKAGHITDVNTALADLAALYRDPAVEPSFVDPNPPPPPPEPTEGKDTKTSKRGDGKGAGNGPAAAPAGETDLEYWRRLLKVADSMFHYKHGERGRNTWQAGQRGGFGEPFYYPADGVVEGIDIVTEAGREVYRKKWGHRDCNLKSANLKMWDQWRVLRDWED